MNRQYDLIKSKEIFEENQIKTLKINNRFIHSRYYPLKEAQKFIDSKDIENYDNIAVFGIGLGYHIYEILNKNLNCNIYVFDILSHREQDLIKNEHIIKVIMDNPRVNLRIASDYNKVLEYIKNDLEKCDELLLLKSYMESIREDFQDFYNVLIDYDAQKKVDLENKSLLEFNKYNNEALKLNDITKFYEDYNLKDKNIFIVSAGPSLNNSLEALKIVSKDKNNFIIAVGTSLGTMKAYNIYPDAICVLDPLDWIYEQVKPFKDSGIPILAFYSSSYKALEYYDNPRYIYYNYKRNDNTVIECSNSVATAALSIAVKSKPKRIIFIGQDLAYVDNKVHSDNTVYGNEHKHFKTDRDLVTEDVYGNSIYTKRFFLDMKIWIERAIKYVEGIEFINCSKGANIIGCKNIEIDRIIEYLN